MTIKGTIDRQGNVIIAFNQQSEKLMLPNGNQFLPCEICGSVLEVNPLVVSFICPECDSERNRDVYEADNPNQTY